MTSTNRPAAFTASVLVDGRGPYAMYEASEMTATGARLRGPLLLEVGEIVKMRIAKGDRTADVSTTVVEVVRGGHDSELVVTFAAADAARLTPLLS